MGHASDWDEVRDMLRAAGIDSQAAELCSAADWQESLQLLAHSIPSESVLVGYSMGARLALGLSLEFADRFAGLVFISGSPGLETPAARQKRWIADQRVANRLDAEPIEQFLEDWYRQSVFGGVPSEVLRAEIHRKQKLERASWPQILRANSVSQQPNYWERLSELKVPTLSIAGERDEKYRAIAKRVEQELHGSQCRIIPDCGHIVHREQPQALVSAIEEFVEQQA